MSMIQVSGLAIFTACCGFLAGFAVAVHHLY
jgi:hypothetical protein